MASDEKRLREYLAYYGADVGAWPDDAQSLGRNAQRHGKFAVLFEEEKRFERLLHKRHIEPARADLAQRIVAAALAKDPFQKPEWWLYDLLTEIKPATLAAMLVLGFAIGFGALAPASQDKKEVFTQPYSDDEETLL